MTATSPFPHLAAPLAIRGHRLANRMIMGPHQSQFGFSDGLPPERLRDYLAAKARGGAGMMIVEGGVTMANSLREPTVLRAYPPEVIERWRPIVAAVHAEGTILIAQLLHGGRQASGYSNFDQPLWAPSAIACPYFREIPKEMERDDLAALVESYVRCARNMRAAGFDGVEIHACHGYLLNEFLSPYTNKRTDEYGGPLEHRMRLLVETVDRVRQEIGDALIVGVRLESCELVAGGFDLDESIVVAEALERGGKVDYLNMSQGVRETGEYIRAPMFMPYAYAADFTAAIKKRTRLPVFVVGRMPHPTVAEAVLAAGKADAVVLTRELIADPDYPRKALDGRADEIRRCVAASECVFNVASGRPLTCIYNPEIGREGLGRMAPAAIKKRVLVIGGGPAGLEAARVAAARGHTVEVCEQEAALGGALRHAAATPGRSELQHIINFYRGQLAKLGVTVRLGRAATVAEIVAAAPDVVVVATGALPLLPPSPLLPALTVEPGARLISYLDALSAPWRGGEHVVLIDGEYSSLAMSVADHLAEKKVTVGFVTGIEKPGIRLDGPSQKIWFQRLCTRGVTLLPYRVLVAARPGAAELKYTHSGAIERIACDAIVYAYTRRANDGLYHELKGRGLDVRRIGDCNAPRPSAAFATHEGFELGASL